MYYSIYRVHVPKAGYDEASEASSRIRIDLMMVEARITARDLIKEEQEQELCDDIVPDLNEKLPVSMDDPVDNSVTLTLHLLVPPNLRPPTPQKRKSQKLVGYPELDPSVEITDTSDAGHTQRG